MVLGALVKFAIKRLIDGIITLFLLVLFVFILILANVFISSGNMWTLTLGMHYLAITNRSTLYNVFAAFSVLMGIPIFIIFIVFQKYLTKVYSLSGTK